MNKACPPAARFLHFKVHPSTHTGRGRAGGCTLTLPWGKDRSVIIYSRFDPLDLIRDGYCAHTGKLVRMINWMLTPTVIEVCGSTPSYWSQSYLLWTMIQ